MRFRNKNKGETAFTAARPSSWFMASRTPSLPLDEHPEISWLDFSNPANPLGTPTSFVETMKDTLALGAASRKPNHNAQTLNQTFAKLYRLPSEAFICGTACADLLQSIMQMIEPSTVGIPVPCPSHYLATTRAAGHHPVTIISSAIMRSDGSSRTVSNNQITGALLGNPLFPTSRLLSKTTLTSFLELCSWVIVDECFLELSLGGESVIPLTQDHPNLLVMRSMSESFAIPGTPVSCCIGHPSVIERMRSQFNPANISIFAEALGNTAIDELSHLERARDVLEHEIPWLQCRLALIPGITVSPAEACFLFCTYRCDRNAGAFPQDAHELVDRLQKLGIIVDTLDGVPGIEKNNSFCVAVKTHAENESLVQAMRTAVAACDEQG